MTLVEDTEEICEEAMKIYTKTGDQGLTSLVSGTRISKDDDRIDLYGDVDDLNSHLGYGLSLIESNQAFDEQKKIIIKIQSSLFNLGSNLACEEKKRLEFNLPQIDSGLIAEVEQMIDIMDAQLQPLKNFILPGGSVESAYFHVVRTKTRQVERKLVRYYLDRLDQAPENSLILLNRLSDFFFICSRYINKRQGIEEIKWMKS